MARLTGQARQNRISDALFSLDSCGGHAPSRACPERSRRVQAEQSSAAATGEGNRFATSAPRSSALPDKDKKVRFDDFELDYGRFQLCRCGSPVRLEGLPLQLLMFMVERRGQLVTREQIASRRICRIGRRTGARHHDRGRVGSGKSPGNSEGSRRRVKIESLPAETRQAASLPKPSSVSSFYN